MQRAGASCGAVVGPLRKSAATRRAGGVRRGQSGHHRSSLNEHAFHLPSSFDLLSTMFCIILLLLAGQRVLPCRERWCQIVFAGSR